MLEPDSDLQIDEEQYVSETYAELEPVVQLIDNWAAKEDGELELNDFNDLQALQEKVRKQESTVRLLAKVSNDLLRLYYIAKEERKEHDAAESNRLKEEVMQLSFHNNTLQHQTNELESQLANADHKIEDLIRCNEKLSVAVASNDTTLTKKVEELQKDNSDLNSQLSELLNRIKSHEKQLTSIREETRKKMNAMQKSLDVKETQVTQREMQEKMLKKDLQCLNERLLAVEIEADELREELEKYQLDSHQFRTMLEKSESENAECREMLFDAKQQLAQYKEKLGRTKLIKHIQNPNSPYIDPDSLACELDRVTREEHWQSRYDASTSEYSSTINWPDDTGSTSCDDLSMSTVDCDMVDGNLDLDLRINYQLPMGQPGRPGTFDLDMALDRLDLMQRWKWKMIGQGQKALPYHNSLFPRIPKSIYIDCNLSQPLSSCSVSGTIRYSSPIQLHIPVSFGGLNEVSCSHSKSGILIRGCVIPDFFEVTNHSICDVEEDDDDDFTLQSFKSKQDSLCSTVSTETETNVCDGSVALSENDSGISVLGSEDTHNESLFAFVPKSLSKHNHKIINVQLNNFRSWKADHGRLDTVLHRSNLSGNQVLVSPRFNEAREEQHNMSSENSQDLPPNCRIS